MELIQTIYLMIAIAVGVGLGWLVWGRDAAGWKSRHAERDEQAREFEAHYKRAEAERGQAEVENARLKADSANFDKQIALLTQAKDDLLAQFKVAGGEVLSKAQEEFLKTAAERFGHAEQANKEAVKSLLDPVHQRLRAYEEQVTSLEQKRVNAFGELTGLITSMREGQEAVRSAAQQLGNSLRNAPKARGRWGEQQLKNVLEQCGLAEHTDFATEQSVETEEGRLRPDAIVRIPGNKLLVIDAKVSLNDYQDAYECDDDLKREACLDRHLASMKNHVQTLASKSYQNQFEEAPDYVLMFVPGEHFIAAAQEHESIKRAKALEGDSLLRMPDLWNYAFERRVLIASPTNLVAICRTVAQVWRQDGLAREAREIGRMGGELYDRLAKVTEDLGKVGTHLGRAVGSYNDFARSFESRVLISAKRLREKHIEIGKREIEEVPLVESAPRYGAADEPATPRLVDTSDDEDARSAG